jgi:hypothetical protein
MCVAFLACSQTKETTTNHPYLNQDTISSSARISENIEKLVRVDSVLAESIKSNQQILSILTKSSGKDPWDIASVIIQAIALIAIYFTLVSLKNERSKRNMDFLSSINKLMIEHPDLRFYKNINRNDIKNTLKTFSGTLHILAPFQIQITGNYDFEILGSINLLINEKPESIIVKQSYKNNNPTSKIEIKSNGPGDLIIKINTSDVILLYGNISNDTHTKIRAFCYYILNNFETILNGNNEELKSGWISYFNSLYSNSSDFKEIVDKSIKQDHTQFTKSFIEKIKLLIQ